MNSKTNINFSNETIYVGIDVHKKSWKVSVFSEHSHFKTFSQEPKTDILVNYLKRNFPNANYKACYESGFSGYWALRELNNMGVNCIVVNPADVPVTDYEKSKKTDAIDSSKLGRSLRSKMLTPIFIPSTKQQLDRDLVRYRSKLVKDQTRCKNRIKSFLFFHGISIPDRFDNSHWSNLFIQWLQNISFDNESGLYTLQTMINQLLVIRSDVLSITRKIRGLSKTEDYRVNVNLLLSVPGIGLVSAMILLTEIISIKRFKRVDDLCSFIGLVPDTGSSGQKEITKNLTNRSNKRIRSIIIESSWVAIRSDPALLLKFNELSNRMNKNKAIIRIAKKVVSRIKHVLDKSELYQVAVVN